MPRTVQELESKLADALDAIRSALGALNYASQVSGKNGFERAEITDSFLKELTWHVSQIRLGTPPRFTLDFIPKETEILISEWFDNAFPKP